MSDKTNTVDFRSTGELSIYKVEPVDHPTTEIEQRLREAMDGVTPGKWKAVVWKHSGGSDTVCIKDSRDREIIAWPGFDGVPCTKAEIRANARFIAAARNNIGALLDTIVSLRSKLEEAEGARGWQPIETAPKDGQVVWAYLYQSGIRAVRFGTAEEWAELEGGSPDEYEDCWVEADNESETWSPRWWLPYGSLPLSPLASLREADHA